jgi:hypothetical protein
MGRFFIAHCGFLSQTCAAQPPHNTNVVLKTGTRICSFIVELSKPFLWRFNELPHKQSIA